MERLRFLRGLASCVGLFLIGACGSNAALQDGVPPAAPATILISNSPVYDFGAQDVNAVATHTFSVTNTGGTAATSLAGSFDLSINFSFLGGVFPGSGGTCTGTLLPSATCTVVVAFTPQYVGSFGVPLPLSYFNGFSTISLQLPKMTGAGQWEAAGNVDHTWFTTGIESVDFAGEDDHGRALIFSPDGKLIALGWAQVNGQEKFAITRLNADGSLDNTFGSSGKVTSAFGSGNSRAVAGALQPDGKLVVVGSAMSGMTSVFAIARYNTDGSLDRTFGNSGGTLSAIGSGNANASAMVLQPDLRIVVAGAADNGAHRAFALARYSVDGTLDISFGTGGLVTTVVGTGDATAQALVERGGGGFFAGGTAFTGSSNDFAFVQYTSAGIVDTSFVLTGMVTFDLNGGSNDNLTAMTLLSDGSVLAVGSAKAGASASEFAVIKVTNAGILDSSFGTAGKVLTAVSAGDSAANGITVQYDNKIVLVGSATPGVDSDFAIVRYSAAGIPDAGFGIGGISLTSAGPGSNALFAVGILPSSKLLTVGDVANGSSFDFALVRYWP